MVLPKFLQFDSELAPGLRLWPIWTSWAYLDIKQAYQRSVIGPLWQTISLGITVSGLAFVYRILWNLEMKVLMPYLSLGMILWTLISGMINDGCFVLSGNSSIIRSINLPLSIYIYRNVLRHFILFAHNIIVFIVLIPIFNIPVGLMDLWAVPGLLIYFVNGVWVTMLLATLSARFRDIPMIVQNFMQLAFFITPIFWMPEALGSKRFIANANVFLHYIDIVRLPLLGQPPLMISWVIVLSATLIGFTVSLVLFVRFRRRCIGWL